MTPRISKADRAAAEAIAKGFTIGEPSPERIILIETIIAEHMAAERTLLAATIRHIDSRQAQCGCDAANRCLSCRKSLALMVNYDATQEQP